jgi:hypothetical protein
MVAVMVLLFAAMLLVRRRQLLNKKSALSNINGKQKNDIKIWYKSITGNRKSFLDLKFVQVILT